MEVSGDAAEEGECNESVRSRACSDRRGPGGHSADGKRRSGECRGAATDGEGLELAGDALEDGLECVGAGRAEKAGAGDRSRKGWAVRGSQWLCEARRRDDLYGEAGM